MKLVEDLIHIKENQKSLLYSPDYNKAVIVDEEVYEHINKNPHSIDTNSLEIEDVEKLLRNGIIYESIDAYNENIFDKILKIEILV